MVDDIADKAEEARKQIADLTSELGKVQDKFTNVNSITKDFFSGIFSGASDAAKSLLNVNDVTNDIIKTMTVLGTALAGVRTSFSSMNFDNRSIYTFKAQINDLSKIFDNSGDSITKYASLAKSMFGVEIPEAVQKILPGETTAKAVERVKQYVLNMAEGADNFIRLGNVTLKAAAATGNLSEVYDKVGKEFQNFNKTLFDTADSLGYVAKSTNTPIEAVEEYYMALSKVPGALNSFVKSAQDPTTKVNMLTAALQLASGSQRDMTDIISDLSTAYNNMGMQGESALKFTARMGELANNLNIPLESVRQALLNATDQFKMFQGIGEKTESVMEGVTRSMNEYIGALKQTGISGPAAVSVVQNMVSQISNLDVAQRSFLSQQSGGPGGLRGAFRIERMIREGNFDEVMRNVQSTLQKQFGRIVTTREAEQSEGAASRAVLQRQMLMAGPLGGLAKNEQEAARLLEAFSARAEGKITPKELSATVLQDTMNTGTKYQQLTATNTGKLVQEFEQGLRIRDYGNLNFLQTRFAARAGTATDYEQKQRQFAFRSEMQKAEIAEAPGTVNKAAEKALNNLTNTIKDMFENLSIDAKGVVRGLSTGELTGSDPVVMAMRNSLKERVEGANTEQDKAKYKKMISEFNSLVDNSYRIAQEKAQARLNAPLNVATNTPSQIARNDLFVKAPTETPPTQSGQDATETPKGKEQSLVLETKITGICIDCNRKMVQNGHTQVITGNGPQQ